jgi:Family of unknown function (DUF5946)
VNPSPCPYCGGVDCESRFQNVLIHDFTDPDFGSVHHLLVAAYMAQHDVYDDATLEVMLEFMARSMDSFPTDHDRAQIRAIFDGSRRAVKRDRIAPPTSPRGWTMTVLDVDDSSAEAYRRTVRTWARSVLETLRAKG